LKGAHFYHILVMDKGLHLMHSILKSDVKIFQETYVYWTMHHIDS